jgi:cytochrome b
MKYDMAPIKVSDETCAHQPSDVGGSRTVKAQVWDLPLRLFHWSMVVAVTVAGITGFIAQAWWLDVHVFAGYAIGILLVFRFAWGVLGSYYSTFKSFPLAPLSALGHVRSLFKNNSPAYTGHNPVGAWMIIALLFVLSALLITGLMVLGGQEGLGPLEFLVDFQIGWRAADLHEAAAWALVGVVAIHLLGVFVEVRLLRHPVLLAMITGNKQLSATKISTPSRSYVARGAALLIITTVALFGGGKMLASIASPGWAPVQVPADYSVECGSCHDAYHPSLRTEISWRYLMSGLSEHYGEDASLDVATERVIEKFLAAHSAGKFDTEAAWRIGRIETQSLRITDTAYWKKRHGDIAERVFKLSSVGSKINCNGCHRDAASGRFADQNIYLPNGDKK